MHPSVPERHAHRIDNNLALLLDTSPDLRRSLIDALDNLENNIDAEISAGLTDNHLFYDPDPVIRISTEFNTLDEYLSIKERARESVRNAERDGVLIFTRFRTAD